MSSSFPSPSRFGLGLEELVDGFEIGKLDEDGTLEFFSLVDSTHADCVYVPILGEEGFESLLESRVLWAEAFLERWIRLASAVGVGTGNEQGWDRQCAYCIDGAFVLTLGFLDLGCATYIGPGFIYLERGAEFAYGVDDPVLTKRLELIHALEGRDRGQWHPVIVVGRVETPHKPEGD
jgi:hypothetical protein